MIEVKNLTKFYGDHKAVDNISFSVKDGTVCGFCGPNGAGKSTTMNIDDRLPVGHGRNGDDRGPRYI